ncbi:MAG: hypothetical protein F6K40_10655 [Okeania sp. SIO3I5]|uniref:PseG/SpsG family protein n=1 Tax=Okeania sp. SIO3I5 TaxID=2607805 RepID=UPI0013B96F96|nr:hypothetical protein [Okeania sp. SIO3I5]NEQ36713.1 hypothetical protein [Okeania sp. SIO3I5]
MKFSVVIQAAGGGSIGVGHLSRTATLASALIDTGCWDRVVLLWEASPELAAHFRPSECEVVLVSDGTSAIRERSRLCDSQGISVLVTDLLNLQSEDIAEAKNQGYRVIVHLNDSGKGRFAADMVVDGDAFKSEKDLPESFEGVGLVGADYRIIRQSVLRLRPAQPWRKNKVEQVLITLGGSDPGNLSIKLLQNLARAKLEPSFSVTVVIGPAFNPLQIDELRLISDRKGWINLVQSPSCLAQFMLECDLIVTLGGITSYEAMCLGRPCAAITWDSMKYYVEKLDSIELIANLGIIDNAANQLIKLTESQDLLCKIAYSGWKKVDGRGADRIAIEINRFINKNCLTRSTQKLFY